MGRKDRDGGMETEDGSLIREARHAAGNLVHRMYYCTELLGEASLDERASEALVALRSSLDGLHRLVGRTMDLLRPVEPNGIEIAAADIVGSIATRFAVRGFEATALESADRAVVDVDPVLLDRALGMLVEVLAPSPGSPPRWHVGVAPRRGMPTSSGLLIVVECDRCSTESADPQADVSGEVGFALASKLLHAMAWKVHLSERPRSKTLRIFVPFVVARRRLEARSDPSEQQRDKQERFLRPVT